MVIINAIYFKSNWITKFDPNLTREKAFRALNGEEKVVTMMATRAKVEVEWFGGHRVLRLPYEGRNMEMMFWLPNRPQDFHPMVDDKVAKFDFTWTHVGIRRSTWVEIPKFEMDSTFDLADILYNLGVKDVFDEKSSDFSNFVMNPNVALKVNNIIQKAFIEVNELGTEAAVATFIEDFDDDDMGCLLDDNPEFICDRPFLFFVRETKTGLILFSGRFANPI